LRRSKRAQRPEIDWNWSLLHEHSTLPSPSAASVEDDVHGKNQCVVVHKRTAAANEETVVSRDFEVINRLDRFTLYAGHQRSSPEDPQSVSAFEVPSHRPSLPCNPEAMDIRGEQAFSMFEF
jgi:hypothetical protein